MPLPFWSILSLHALTLLSPTLRTMRTIQEKQLPSILRIKPMPICYTSPIPLRWTSRTFVAGCTSSIDREEPLYWVHPISGISKVVRTSQFISPWYCHFIKDLCTCPGSVPKDRFAWFSLTVHLLFQITPFALSIFLVHSRGAHAPLHFSLFGLRT